ncbi:MAG: hypothetical protein CL855_07455 [Cryomorphaceae bacterium]|nr:hypothetical protein [Cryomorphaceae bacterium]|tara:strand:- start:45 stop:251 length:207 start_codon:yes stop_codon:yes gene_type:complete
MGGNKNIFTKNQYTLKLNKKDMNFKATQSHPQTRANKHKSSMSLYLLILIFGLEEIAPKPPATSTKES